MAEKDVWVKFDGTIRGPFSASILRELVRTGRVVPDTPISLDKARWVPASKVNGLFETPRPGPATMPVPPPRNTSVPNRAPAQSGSTKIHCPPPAEGCDSPLFPIIRVQRRRFGRTDITAIYETHVITGKRARKSLPITEEMCHPAGEPALKQIMRGTKSLDFADVTEVREKVPPQKNRRLRWSKQEAKWEFWLLSGKQAVHLSLPATQTANVRTALAAKLADRPWTKIRPKGEGNTDALPQDLPQRKPVLRARLPFRSRWLGWTLKALGIAYWIIIASPLTDGLSEHIDDALKNNSYNKSILWSLIWAPSPLLIYAGYQLCQRRYDSSGRGDTRKPILFLRPFEDDSSTSLQPPGMLAAITGIRAEWMSNVVWITPRQGGRITLNDLLLKCHPARLLRMVLDYGVGTSEESLVRYFQSFGPVIAIGKPGESLATPGAARMYVADDQWQEAIRSELQRSQAVVVQPGLSAGVQWELDEIRARVDPHRVLLCLVSLWRNPQAYEDLASLARKSLWLELPRVVPFLNRPSFIYFERGWIPRLQELSYKNPVWWPLTADAADLAYTLHSFVQGISGEEREMPRLPRWDRGIGKAAANVAAFLLGLVFAIGPVLAVHAVGRSVVQRGVGPTASSKQSSAILIQQLLNIVNQSPLTTVEGRAVPYRFEIPEAFGREVTDKVMVEHHRRSPDGRMFVIVTAHDQREDLSGLAKLRLEMNSKGSSSQVTLNSTRTVRHAGVDWVESVIGGKLKNGDVFKDTMRATTGPGGTVLLNIVMMEFPDTNPTYERLSEEILKSFRFFERSGPAVKPTEPGPASGSTAMSVPTSPSNEPTPRPEEQTPELIARSSRITLQGRAIPYWFEMPKGLVNEATPNAMIEHWRKSPDGCLQVQVVAHEKKEDLSQLGEQLVKANSQEGVLECKLKSVRTVKHAGADWIEAAVLIKLKSGEAIQQLCRGTSGARGTVVVTVTIISSPGSDPIYQRVALEMLQSFRFAEKRDRRTETGG